MQRYALFPEHANFSGIFFIKKGIFRAFFDLGQGYGEGIHIIYICAREGWTSPAAELRGTGRKGRDGRRGRDGGDGRETEPRSKTAGHSGYNGRGTGDGLDKMGRGYSRGLCMVNITVPQMQKVSSGEISIWG